MFKERNRRFQQIPATCYSGKSNVSRLLIPQSFLTALCIALYLTDWIARNSAKLKGPQSTDGSRDSYLPRVSFRHKKRCRCTRLQVCTTKSQGTIQHCKRKRKIPEIERPFSAGQTRTNRKFSTYDESRRFPKQTSLWSHVKQFYTKAQIFVPTEALNNMVIIIKHNDLRKVRIYLKAKVYDSYRQVSLIIQKITFLTLYWTRPETSE